MGIQKEAVCSAIVAYFVQNLFIYDTEAPLVGFIFLAAYIFSMQQHQKPVIAHQKKYIPILFVSLFLIPIYLWSHYLFPTFTFYTHIKQAHILNKDQPQKALDQLSFIDQYTFVFDRVLLADTYAKILIPEGINQSNLAFKKSIAQHPLRYEDWYKMISLYVFHTMEKEDFVSSEMITETKNATNLAPARMEVLLFLQLMYEKNKDKIHALEIAEKIHFLRL